MIYGVGTDICDVRRVRDTFERRGERFAQRVLTDRELAIWRQRGQRWPERGLRYLATRFSAKEAFSKAVGLGLRSPMQWRRCEIVNAPGGQPRIVLHDALAAWFDARQLVAHLSISDESEYVASFCVVERRE